MLKHVMLVTYSLQGPELDSWACAPWPYPPGKLEAKALLQLIGEEHLAPEARELCIASGMMELRGRFQTNARFIVVNDHTDSITTREQMQAHLKSLPKRRLKKLMGQGEWIHSRGVV